MASAFLEEVAVEVLHCCASMFCNLMPHGASCIHRFLISKRSWQERHYDVSASTPYTSAVDLKRRMTFMSVLQFPNRSSDTFSLRR